MKEPFYDVAIIGGGFCGLMTAAHLAASPEKMRVAVISENADLGPGLAYGACDAQHFLNVAAARMGAYPDKPDDFLRWVEAHEKINPAPGEKLEDAFLPRSVFAKYLRGIAAEIPGKMKAGGHEFSFINARAGDVSLDGRVFKIAGADIISEKLVLATGAPPAVAAKNDPADFMADPWKTDFAAFRDKTDPVVILGAGLTMIDVVYSLSRAGFKGPIAAYSRRGLSPLPAAPRDDTQDLSHLNNKFALLEGPLSRKIQRFRRNAEIAEENGASWESYLYSMRPLLPKLWAAAPLKEQKKFLKRVNAYWSVHRHRQPQRSHEMLRELSRKNIFSLHRGKMEWRMEKTLAARFADAEFKNVARVFNCRGADYSLAAAQGLLRHMLEKDLLRRHENGLGVQLDERLSAIGAGRGKLYVAGALTAGARFDSASVPEIRRQCAEIAKAIVS